LKIDRKLELARLHDWEVGAFVALDRRLTPAEAEELEAAKSSTVAERER
jgi:hypothetical protein